MSLAKALREKPLPLKHPCLVGREIQQRSVEDQTAFNQVVERIQKKEDGFTIAWLNRILRAEGIQTSLPTLRRHISKECGCHVDKR